MFDTRYSHKYASIGTPVFFQPSGGPGLYISTILTVLVYLVSFVLVLVFSTNGNIRYCIPVNFRYGEWSFTDATHPCHAKIDVSGTEVINECFQEQVTVNSTSIDGVTLLGQATFVPGLFLMGTLVRFSQHVSNVENSMNSIRWFSNAITDGLIYFIIIGFFGIDDLMVYLFGFFMVFSSNIIQIARENWPGPGVFIPWSIQFVSTLLMAISWIPPAIAYGTNSGTALVDVIFLVYVTAGALVQVFQILISMGTISNVDGEYVHLFLPMLSRVSVVWLIYFMLLNSSDVVMGLCL